MLIDFISPLFETIFCKNRYFWPISYGQGHMASGKKSLVCSNVKSYNCHRHSHLYHDTFFPHFNRRKPQLFVKTHKIIQFCHLNVWKLSLSSNFIFSVLYKIVFSERRLRTGGKFTAAGTEEVVKGSIYSSDLTKSHWFCSKSLKDARFEGFIWNIEFRIDFISVDNTDSSN